jgi:hypothetical protein
MDELHSRARARLFGDPERLERYVAAIARRLHMSQPQARVWLKEQFESNEYPLVDAVVNGVDVTGRIAYS